MPIKITKKRVLPPTPEPEALVDPRPETPAVVERSQTRTTVAGLLPYADRTVAKTCDELRANKNTMRMPTPTACTFCKHMYGFPCQGKDKDCMNAQWIRSGKTTAKVSA